MIRRRRRRPSEIHFSFDSFLDVVANVVGIIIRFILVIWVGARSYHSLRGLELPSGPEPIPALAAASESAESDSEPPFLPDPMEGELARQRQELARAEAVLLEGLKDLEQTRVIKEQKRRDLDTLAARARALTAEQTTLASRVAEGKKALEGKNATVEEVRARCARLAEEVKKLQELPRTTKTLRYRTPVSKPLDAEELMFECRQGRITFIDVGGLLEEIKRGIREKGETLRRSWEVHDTAGPIGPFQLRYTVERQNGGGDVLGRGGNPDPEAAFNYGVSGWEVEAVKEVRGETPDQAFKPGSEFRQIVDGLDARYAAVTIWVYPDSFPVYRQLRDYLYQKDLVVAGRPLPEGAPIASSRHGTSSRGQ